MRRCQCKEPGGCPKSVVSHDRRGPLCTRCWAAVDEAAKHGRETEHGLKEE